MQMNSEFCHKFNLLPGDYIQRMFSFNEREVFLALAINNENKLGTFCPATNRFRVIGNLPNDVDVASLQYVFNRVYGRTRRDTVFSFSLAAGRVTKQITVGSIAAVAHISVLIIDPSTDISEEGCL